MYFSCAGCWWWWSCADPESFVREKALFMCFLYSWWGKRWSTYHLKRAIIGPLAKRCLLNGVSLACRWWPPIECWLGSFVIFRGSRPVLLKKLYFCDFSGGPNTPPAPPPPLWIRPWFCFCFGWWWLCFLCIFCPLIWYPTCSNGPYPFIARYVLSCCATWRHIRHKCERATVIKEID